MLKESLVPGAEGARNFLPFSTSGAEGAGILLRFRAPGIAQSLRNLWISWPGHELVSGWARWSVSISQDRPELSSNRQLDCFQSPSVSKFPRAAELVS